MQPAQPPQPATPGDINAIHNVSGSIMMLVLVILNTCLLGYSAIKGFMSGGLGIVATIFGSVADVLMCVGLWLIWANGRKRSNQTTGFTLFKVGLIINFVFTMIFSLLTVIAAIALLAIGGFIMPVGLFFIIIGLALIGEFVLEIIVFASLNGFMKHGPTILKLGLRPRDPAKKTAGVALIIRASLALLPNLMLLIAVLSAEAKINEILGKLPEFLANIAKSFLNVGAASKALIPGVIVGVITLAVAIYYAIVMFKYVKEAKAARQ
jgi:hypothetical protein